MKNLPKPDETTGGDRIPVPTERASGASYATAEPDLAALTERVLHEIAPTLHPAIATACKDYLAAREARSG